MAIIRSVMSTVKELRLDMNGNIEMHLQLKSKLISLSTYRFLFSETVVRIKFMTKKKKGCIRKERDFFCSYADSFLLHKSFSSNAKEIVNFLKNGNDINVYLALVIAMRLMRRIM
jgi:hypothetical protein